MPDPKQQDHSLYKGGLMFRKYITVHILGVPSGKCQRGEFVYLL